MKNTGKEMNGSVPKNRSAPIHLLKRALLTCQYWVQNLLMHRTSHPP